MVTELPYAFSTFLYKLYCKNKNNKDLLNIKGANIFSAHTMSGHQ